MERDGLRQQTVDRYASTGKVHFRKIPSVTLTVEPMTLKMSTVSRGPGSE